MCCGYNFLRMIILFFLTGNNHVNGLTTLLTIVSRSGALVNPTPVKKGVHPMASIVVVNAAHRRRADDTTPNADAANPKLRGIRQINFGQKQRTWMESYEALLEFKRLNQHCRVPQYYSLDRRLGIWVQSQRYNGRKALSLEQLELLDKAGFDWESKDERNNRLWQESYQKLIEYKEEHGDCCVPQKYESDRALGWWVCDQRRFRKQGILRADREEHLDAIGFTWSVRGGSKHKDTERADRLWNEMYEILLEFRKKWGHCLVPRPFDENPSLGQWVDTQRTLFKRRQLRSDRKKRLEEVGFEFDPNNTDQNLQRLYWDVMFQHLVDYKATHGDTNVKANHEEFGLRNWVQRQRQNKNVMDEQRRKQLDGIGFMWSNPRNQSTAWQERFEELREHNKLHGTCRVKKKENARLAKWVYRQRWDIKRGELSEAKIKQLESIGFA